MARRFVRLSALTLGGVLVASLVACAPQPAPEEQREAAACSQTVYLKTRNEIKEWWSGQSLPVTWKSKVERNSDFDGGTRPDHAPPQGFQGLVQTTESGTHTQPIEYSALCGVGDSLGGSEAGDRKTMELTPTVTIDGQTIELSPISFANSDLGSPVPYQTFGSQKKYYDCGELVVHTYSTPRGFLQNSSLSSAQTRSNMETRKTSSFR